MGCLVSGFASALWFDCNLCGAVRGLAVSGLCWVLVHGFGLLSGSRSVWQCQDGQTQQDDIASCLCVTYYSPLKDTFAR
eukprot:6466014-Amphidinium_carterae.1